jgi:WD40 repeat protein
MILPALLLLSHYLAPAPAPQLRLNLPETEGKLLLTSGNTPGNFGRVYVWQRDTGRLVTEWQAHQSFASLVALSASGKVLLTRGASTALVWDLDGLLQRKGSR